MMRPWWTMRSMTAAAMSPSPNTSPHRPNSVFCQAVVVHCGVSFQSEKAGEISPFRHRSCLVLVWLLHEGVGLAVGVALESDHPAVVDGAVD